VLKLGKTKKRIAKKAEKKKNSSGPPKQKAPMPEGVLFEKGNQAAFKYREEYADLMMNYANDESVIYPSVEDFAKRYNIPVRTLSRWVAESKENEEKYPRLADTHAHLQFRQKQVLIEKGLTDKYNASIVKFLLANNHGMSEKTAAEVNAKTDNKFEVNIKVIE
jgi:hypothetical protein